MKRVIYIEPEIDNQDIINLFNEYNPDSSFVNPHICLVFPFKSDIKSETINEIMNSVFDGMEEFELELRGISVSYEEKNNFVFLNVDDKEQKLSEMSKLLYSKLGGCAVLKGTFTPHITIGKNPSLDAIDEIKVNVEQKLNSAYTCKIKNVKSSIMILDNNNIFLQPENVVSFKSVFKKHI